MQSMSKISDIEERALRVNSAVKDDSTWTKILYKYDSDPHICLPDTLEKTTRRLIHSSAGLISLLRAALLIRKNYESWVKYLRMIPRPPPEVFECFARNRKLVFFLYMCDCYKVFRLDPRYPFLNGCNNDSERIFIIGEHNKQESMKPVLDLWLSAGSPGSITDSNFLRYELEKLRRKPEAYRCFPLGTLFWRLSCEFGIERFMHDEDFAFWEVKFIWFEMNKFVEEASIALAFDHENELLELIKELFPQFPNLICDICREYHLSAGHTISPHYKRKFENIPPYYLDAKRCFYYNEVRVIIQEEMNCFILLYKKVENDEIRHAGVLNMIKRYPHLFVLWKTDKYMADIYKQLIGNIDIAK